MLPHLAIIGGNALGALPGMVIEHRRVERTPYGDPSSPLVFGKLGGHSVVFLARHGVSFHLAPDEVNDVANIYALQQTGAQAIIGISSAIALTDDLAAGDFVLPDQLIDMSNQRIARFPRPANTPYQPLQFAEPFDRMACERLFAARPANIRAQLGGTYVLTSGLRSETIAEAQFYRNIGGTALGATGAQEAALARDVRIPFVSLLVMVRRAANQSRLPINLNFVEIAQTLSQWLGNY